MQKRNEGRYRTESTGDRGPMAYVVDGSRATYITEAATEQRVTILPLRIFQLSQSTMRLKDSLSVSETAYQSSRMGNKDGQGRTEGQQGSA